MYYLAKIAQATGLAVIGSGFIMSFPRLMNVRIFSVGGFLFLFGWIVERYLLKNR